MNVIERKINVNYTLPSYKTAKYPQPLDNNLPRNYNVAIFCGARGSGKTTIAVNLLYQIEKSGIENGIEPRVILISPTAKSDSNKIFEVLKCLNEYDIMEDYDEGLLKDKIEELKQDLQDIEDYHIYKKLYKKYVEKKSNLNNITYDDFQILEKNDFKDPDDIKPRYENGFMIYLIVDDMLGTNIFKSGKSFFTNMVIKNRHKSSVNIPMNIWITTQQIFAIPKTIRLNSNFIVLFKFGNKSVILQDLYVLVSSYLSPEEFEMLYNKATEEAHNCLVIDMTNNKPIFKKNLDTILEIEK